MIGGVNDEGYINLKVAERVTVICCQSCLLCMISYDVLASIDALLFAAIDTVFSWK